MRAFGEKKNPAGLEGEARTNEEEGSETEGGIGASWGEMERNGVER